MNDKRNERYLRLGVTGCGIALFTLVCYFILSDLKGFGHALGVVFRILTPFLYGGVIAYIVLPLCRRLERLFHRAKRAARNSPFFSRAWRYA